jgi:hypothetical protein
MLARFAKALLSRLIDYAGLFPPAALSMEEAVQNYARYREGEHAWMLGRFVVPQARAHEVPAYFPVSVLGVDEIKFSELEIPLPSQLEPRTSNLNPTGASGSRFEVRAEREEAVPRFIEITDVDLIAHLAKHNLAAKIRTGGVTADAIPDVDHVATFIRVCALHGIPFKATAGLHHPVRCMRALTYEADAPRATMHGFLNVFMAAAFPHDAERVLSEEDPHAFRFEDDVARWRDKAVTTEHLAAIRRDFAISFGSCSFEEPVNELKELGIL